MDKLHDLACHAADRASFVAFLDALRSDLARELARPSEETAWGAGDWSHPDLAGYQETLAAWLTDSGRFDRLEPTAWQAYR